MDLAHLFTPPLKMPRRRLVLGVWMVLALSALAMQRTSAGTLSSVSPSGATPGITLTILGSGFHTTAANNLVTFTPVAGAPIGTSAKTVTTVDASSGLRRITVAVPDGLPIGTTGLTVTNTVTGEISPGASFELLALTVSGANSGPPGRAGIQMAVQGSPNAVFVAGSTKVSFGAGVTVTALTVDSPTLLHATVSIAATAALGPRTVSASTSTQTLALLNAFAVATGPVNQAPVVSAGPVQTVTLPAGASLSGTVGDDGLPTGATVTSAWSKFSGPGSVAFANAANPITTATFDTAGSYVLRLTASDTLLSAFSDVTVTVNPAVVTPPTNLPPTVNAGTNQTVTLPAGASLSGTVSDDGLPTGATVTSAWSKFSGPGSVAFANAANPITTATFDTAGSYVLRLTASDTLLSAFSDVTITVNPAVVTPPTNLPPTVNAGTNQTVTLPAGASLSGTVSDDGLPTGATVTSAWSKFSGPGSVAFANAANPITTATFDTAGSYVLRLTASDTLLSAFSDVTVTVNPAVVTPPTNLPPTVNAGTNQTVTLPAGASLSGTVSDDGLPTGATVTSAWSKFSGPGSVAFANAANPITTATFDTAGSYVLRLTASDTLLSAFSDVTVTVNPAVVTPPTNHPPTIAAGGPYSGSTRAPIAFAAAANDPDGDPLTVTWDFGDATPPGGGVSSSHQYASAGAYTVSVTATDTHGASAVATAPVSVVLVNSAPAFTSSPTTTARLQAPYSYPSAATDPDGDSVTFSLSLGPTGMTVDAHSGQVTWTPAADQAGTQPVTIVASDPFHAASSQSFQIAVTDGTAPVITLSMPSEALPGATVPVTADATDNVGVASVTFEVNGADPVVQTAVPFGRSIAVPATALVGTEFHVRATARDAAGNAGVADRSFKVAAVPDIQPPIVTLNAPTQAAPGTTIHLTATSTDNVGVKAVAFKLASALLASDPDTPYEFNYSIPADAVVGSTLSFSARATDFSDNFADAGATVTIIATPDTTVPTVLLITAASVAEGTTLPVSATAADDVGVAEVTFYVNGVAIGTSTNAPYTGSYVLPSGVAGGDLLHVEARALDFSGNAGSNAHDVVVLPAPNRLPTALAGGPYAGEVGDAIALDASASSDPDQGDRLTFDWDFGDTSTGSGRSPLHAYASEGTYAVTLTVSDGRGGTATGHASVLVTATTDRVPPSVSLTGPSSVLPGAQVTMTAQASDNKGVVAVAFSVNGGDAVETATVPYQQVVSVPTVAAPGDVIVVRATARDAAGNSAAAEASLTISGVPDTEKPTITLNAPPQVGAGATLHLSAVATDNVGVASVAFLVNGLTISTLPAPPYEAMYSVPADAAAGTSIGVVAQATDYNGNQSSSESVVNVVQATESDTTPPTVKVTAPRQVFAGKTLSLSADAADNVGVASVAFFVNGTNIGTRNAAPYAVTFPLGDAQAAGSVLQVQAKAIDFSGLDAIDAVQTLVVSASSAGQGSVTGEVYDDSTSLAIAGATVALTGQDSTGTDYTQTTTTDDRGRWVLRAVEGSGVVQIGKDGWTRVDRPSSIVVDQALELFDARLTPLGSAAQSLSAVLGGVISSGGNSLTVSPGALATATSLTLSALTSQGLEGVVPSGWSPVAAVDVTPHGIPFSVPASLSLSPFAGITAGTGRTLVLATWDEQTAQWRAIAVASAAGTSSIVGGISSSGQYAWLMPDEVPLSPPLPAPGDPIQGVALTTLDAAATTVVDPQPRILFYKPGVRSDVHGAIATMTPASSGLPIETRLTESYQFFDGTQRRPEPFVEDLFFYQTGTVVPGIAGVFTVAPSQSFDPLSLQLGVISVELLSPPLGPRTVTTIDVDGGPVVAPSGESLRLPQGATGQPLPISVRGLTTNTIGVTVPNGLDLVGAALVSFSGTLAKPAALSVPTPAGAIDPASLLVVRVREIGGETRLLLVARALVVGGQIVSDTTLGSTADAFEGLRVPGRYLIVRATTPIGFAKGAVTTGPSTPDAGVLISAAGMPVVALSGASGGYVAAAPVGPVSLTATDLVTSDIGTATGAVASAGGIASIDVRILAAVPTVTAISPSDGAGNIPLSTPIVIRFSRPIDPASVNGANAGSVVLAGPDGTPIAASIALSNGNNTLTLRPVSALQSNTSYAIAIATTVTDAVGRHLASPVTAHFSSFDTSPPPMPAAGSISASIPASDGFTTIVATQGTAGVHDTVTVVNLTRKTTTPVLVDPNGSFTVKVAVGLADRLQIAITGQNGSQTTVDVGRFTQTNADGSVSTAIGSDGGRATGASGEVVDVPAGAFPNGAVVTVKMIAESQFPVQLSDKDRQNFSFTAGIQLDLGGQLPQKYLNVGIPVRGGETEDDQWIVAQAVDYAGRQRMTVVDTAHVIDDRITTSSPPCPGVTGGGTYGFLRPGRPAGVLFGPLDRGLPGAVFAPFLAGPGLISLDVPDGLLGLYDSVNSTVDSLEPYLSNIQTAYSALTNPSNYVCIPTLSGAVTVSANRLALAVPAGTLTDADIEVDISNVTRNTPPLRVFPPFGASIGVEGSNSDSFAAEAIDNHGAHRSIALTPRPRSFVKLEIAGLTAQDTRIVARNETRNLTQSVPFNGSSLVPFAKLLMEGTATDAYSVRIDGAAPRSLAPTVSAYPFGSGNLALRAIFGSIDPTLSEIQQINALLPADRQISEVGVNSVVLRNVTLAIDNAIVDVGSGSTDSLVGGAMAFAFDGGPTDVYKIIVHYDGGHPDVEVMIPNFHVSVTDPDTGATRLISGQTPPRGEPLMIDLGPPGVGPATVSFDVSAFHGVDPTVPITLEFSSPLDPASVATAVALYDSSGAKVSGQWSLSVDRLTLTFVPTASLQLDASYTIALSGVRDAHGRLIATTTLPLTTFKPVRLSHLVLPSAFGSPFPVRDLGFMRQLGPLNEERTNVVAVTGNQLGSKLFTIDVTDARVPLTMGETAGGSFKRRVTLLHTDSDIQYDVQLVPQQTSMSCWAAGAAMIVGWRDRISIDPSSIAAQVAGGGYWHQYQAGLPGYDKAMFAEWGLVPAPQASYDVQAIHDMLDQFGPLWVASRVPSVHIRVITGISGDGTPDGTLLHFNDPWQKGMTLAGFNAATNTGAQYALTFSEFIDEEESLARTWLGVDLVPFIQDLCHVDHNALACDRLNDPVVFAQIQQCAAGQQDVCDQIQWTGVRGTYIAHLPAKPAWVPPAVSAPLTVTGPVDPLCSAHVSGSTFIGDLAVSSSWNLDSTYLTYFDVTDTSKPCVIGGKTLTANPERPNSFTGPGTFKIEASARGVATIHHAQGYAAYVAHADGGIAAADIGHNIPEPNPAARTLEGFYSGDVMDVATIRDRVLALNNNSGGNASLDILTPDLSIVTSIDLGTFLASGQESSKVHRLVTVRGVSVDRNGDGAVTDDEIFDLAFIAGARGIVIVDISNLDNPQTIGSIAMPGFIRELDVDPSGTLLLAGGDRTSTVNGDEAIFLVSLSNPFAPADPDPSTGMDRRVAFVIPYAGGVAGSKIDMAKGRLYVGWPGQAPASGGVDVWAFTPRGTAGNQPPTANAGTDQTVDLNSTVHLDGRRSADPDGDPLNFTWKQTSGPQVALQDDGTATPSFVAPNHDGDVLSFQLIVDDGTATSDPATVTVTVHTGAHP